MGVRQMPHTHPPVRTLPLAGIFEPVLFVTSFENPSATASGFLTHVNNNAYPKVKRNHTRVLVSCRLQNTATCPNTKLRFENTKIGVSFKKHKEKFSGEVNGNNRATTEKNNRLQLRSRKSLAYAYASHSHKLNCYQPIYNISTGKILLGHQLCDALVKGKSYSGISYAMPS
jgi:hypothetical protein